MVDRRGRRRRPESRRADAVGDPRRHRLARVPRDRRSGRRHLDLAHGRDLDRRRRRRRRLRGGGRRVGLRRSGFDRCRGRSGRLGHGRLGHGRRGGGDRPRVLGVGDGAAGAAGGGRGGGCATALRERVEAGSRRRLRRRRRGPPRRPSSPVDRRERERRRALRADDRRGRVDVAADVLGEHVGRAHDGEHAEGIRDEPHHDKIGRGSGLTSLDRGIGGGASAV